MRQPTWHIRPQRRVLSSKEVPASALEKEYARSSGTRTRPGRQDPGDRQSQVRREAEQPWRRPPGKAKRQGARTHGESVNVVYPTNRPGKTELGITSTPGPEIGVASNQGLHQPGRAHDPVALLLGRVGNLVHPGGAQIVKVPSKDLPAQVEELLKLDEGEPPVGPD